MNANTIKKSPEVSMAIVKDAILSLTESDLSRAKELLHITLEVMRRGGANERQAGVMSLGLVYASGRTEAALATAVNMVLPCDIDTGLNPSMYFDFNTKRYTP